jgi:hypothetical protein
MDLGRRAGWDEILIEIEMIWESDLREVEFAIDVEVAEYC